MLRYQPQQRWLRPFRRLALRNLDLKPIGTVQGERNIKLFRHCMKAAHHVDDFDALLDVARTFNDNCLLPMEDSEVISAAQSAWG